MSEVICGCCDHELSEEEEDYAADIKYGVLCHDCAETIEELNAL